MDPLYQRDIELELLVCGPAQARLRLAEMIEQGQQLLLRDGLAQTQLVGRLPRRMDLADQHIPKQAYEICKEARQILSGLSLSLDDGQGGGRVAADKGACEIENRLARGEPEDAVDIGGADGRAAERNHLIKHRLGITHRSVGAAGDGSGGLRSENDLLVFGNMLQVRRDQFRRQPTEIEPLAAAENRGRHLLCLGRGKEELHVLRRFLQCLEQGVESRGAEHVHLVDEVDLVGAASRSVGGVLAERADALDAVVAGTVDLHHIEATPFGDLDAGIAGAAGVVGRPLTACLAIQRLGQDAGRGCFPDPAGTDKEISLRQPLASDGILQRPGDVFLPDDLFKALGAVFAGEDAVAHGE